MAGALDRQIEIVSDVFARPFDGELVVLDLAGGEYYGLDAIGAEVWKALEQGTSLASVVDRLLVEYEVDRSTLEADILALLSELETKGLVRLSPP